MYVDELGALVRGDRLTDDGKSEFIFLSLGWGTNKEIVVYDVDTKVVMALPVEVLRRVKKPRWVNLYAKWDDKMKEYTPHVGSKFYHTKIEAESSVRTSEVLRYLGSVEVGV